MSEKRCGNPSCTRVVRPDYDTQDVPKHGLCDRCDHQRAILAAVIYAGVCVGRAQGAAPPDPGIARRGAEALLVELDKPFGA